MFIWLCFFIDNFIDSLGPCTGISSFSIRSIGAASDR